VVLPLEGSHSPEELLYLRLQELQALLPVILESQASISSLTDQLHVADAAAGRSQLQIELILRSLNRSSANQLGKALR